MNFLNLLATQVNVFGPTFDVALNWIGEIIKIIIMGVSSVGVGIILFSLILKGIVLPVDIIQRITMRKQNIKMKENQERMEKLQKQYANNKDLYNQKVMEMYKENGLSMFSSCLPMILSLIIFIVAINAFNAFSQYANIDNYNTLVNAYNAKVESYCPDLDVAKVESTTNGETTTYYIEVKDDNSLLYFTIPADATHATMSHEALVAYVATVPNYTSGSIMRTYYVNAEALAANADSEEVQAIQSFIEANKAEYDTEDKALVAYFERQGALAAKAAYESTVATKTSFIWIKNIWVTDASYRHPVLSYTDFEKEVSREKFEVNGVETALTEIKNKTNAYEKESYEAVMSQMDEHQSSANGYFVLIALSIATILLQQVITNRSQKEQQKYSTVDGQGATQQKTMMVTMTIMFAVFSFMYSSAFSIYMITSNLFSMLSTVIINKCVDLADKKKKGVIDEKYSARHARTLGNKKDK